MEDKDRKTNLLVKVINRLNDIKKRSKEENDGNIAWACVDLCYIYRALNSKQREEFVEFLDSFRNKLLEELEIK